MKGGKISMTIELLKALLFIAKFCYEQDNCKVCPIKDICGKIPCEW